MIRLLIFILTVVFFAAAATLLFSLGDVVRVEAFGWKLDAPAGIAGAVVALGLGAVAAIVSIVKDVTGIRRRSALRQMIRRRNMGVDALVAAAAAQTAGKDARALSLSLKAARLLDRDDVAAVFAPALKPASEATPGPEIPAAVPPAGLQSEPGAPDPALEIASPKAAIPAPQPAMAAALASPPETAADTLSARDAEATLDRDAAAARHVS